MQWSQRPARIAQNKIKTTNDKILQISIYNDSPRIYYPTIAANAMTSCLDRIMIIIRIIMYVRCMLYMRLAM